jgi:5-methylthioribose kinase
MSDASYPILDLASVPSFLVGVREARERLGGAPESWRVREVGDGNLNLVFIVEGAEGSVCLKQALPYVRAAGPAWPMSPERARFEHEYFRAVAPHVGRLIPEVYHFEPELHCLVMERLSPHVILRQGLIGGQRYPNVARDMGEYVAHSTFFTSDLAVPFERKLEGMALFALNKPLIRISVDLIFAEPYFAAERNRHTTPQLDTLVAQLRGDAALKVGAARFGHKFLTEAQALVHGDLHSGSVMVTPSETRVIDPEFAFYGPIGFDLGAFFANLLLAWYSQPGHATAQDDRRAQAAWILQQAQIFWSSFQERFLALWREQAAGDAFTRTVFQNPGDAAPLAAARQAYVDALFGDMLGFGACKMIRRILGFAHVQDFESIADPERRAPCEAAALRCAGLLLKSPGEFRSMQAVLEAVSAARDQR